MLQGPPAWPWSSKWCHKSGWARLCRQLASDWWESKRGSAGTQREGLSAATAPLWFWAGLRVQAQASSQCNAKRCDLYGLRFWKSQKSVYKQWTSPNITDFCSLTSPSGRERRPEAAAGASARQRVPQRAPAQLCHLSAVRAEVKLVITICPFERNCSFVVDVVIELKKTENLGAYLIGSTIFHALLMVMLKHLCRAPRTGSLLGAVGLQMLGDKFQGKHSFLSGCVFLCFVRHNHARPNRFNRINIVTA